MADAESELIMPRLGFVTAALITCLFVAGHGYAADAPQGYGSFGRSLRFVDGRPAVPEIAFKDETGRDWGFVEFRGKVIVAVFWATWCPICAREMPKFDRLQADLGEKGLLVAALSQDRGGAEIVERYYAARNIRHLRIFMDPGSVMASVLGIRGVPTVFIIDQSGRMVGVLEGGADWNSPQAYAFLGKLLAQGDGFTESAREE